MQGIAWFLIVLGIAFWAVLGMEYVNMIQGETWTPVPAKVENSINSLPLTRFEPNRLNAITAVANWSYIKYSYMIGEGRYDDAKELGPHLSMFDFMVGPLAQRMPKGSEFEIRVNPENPKETKLGFDVFRPFEMFFGTGAVFFGLGCVVLYLTKVISTATGDDEDLNKPIEYHEEKRRRRPSSDL